MREDQNDGSPAGAEAPMGVYFEFLLETYRQAMREIAIVTVITRSLGLAGVFVLMVALSGPVTIPDALVLLVTMPIFWGSCTMHRLRLQRRILTAQRRLGQADKCFEDDFIRFRYFDAARHSMSGVLRLYAQVFQFEEMLWLSLWLMVVGVKLVNS